MLLKAVYDVTLAGDDAPETIGARSVVQSMLAAPDARTCLGLYARLGRELGERTLTMVTMLYAQAAMADALVGPARATGAPSGSSAG